MWPQWPGSTPCQKSNTVRLLSVWWEYSKTAQFINLSIDNSTVRMEHNHARHSFILYFDDSGWEHRFIKPRTFIFCEIYIFYTSLSLLGHRMPGAFLQLSWRRWGSSWTQGHINTHTHTGQFIRTNYPYLLNSGMWEETSCRKASVGIRTILLKISAELTVWSGHYCGGYHPYQD